MSGKMIRNQFQKEIKKGTGRAILLMRENPEVDFSAEILRACYKNLDYDPQCSDSRGSYLYEMIQNVKNRTAVEAQILNKLQQSNLEYWAMAQLFEIAKLIAKSGNTQARRVMYKKYEQLCSGDENDITGNYEIISLDGLEGLAFIAELHGKMLLKSKESWEDGAFIQFANDELKGRGNPNNFLKAKAKKNKYIKAYLTAVEDYKRKNKRRKLNAPTYEVIKDQVDSNKSYSFYRVRRMPLVDIKRLAEDFKIEKNPKRLISYLRMFVQVKYPYSSKDLIKYLSHGNKTIKSWATFALKHFSGREIRAIIKNNFEKGECLWETFHLLEENYKVSDNKYIEKLLLQETDQDAFHSMGMSISDVFKKFGSRGLIDSMLISYNKGYCANCRHRLMQNLIEKNMLPKWLAEEAAYDCDHETRILAKDYLGH